MMTREQAEALGKRALAAGWDLVRDGRMHCVVCEQPERWGCAADEQQLCTPDFRDAATRGILLEQVMVRLGLSSWNAVGEYTGDFSAEALVSELELAKKWLAKSPTEAPS